MSDIRHIMFSIPEGYPMPKRDRIAKAVEQYKDRFFDTAEGSFYISDMINVLNMSDDDIYTIVTNALMAGFMIGYKKACRDAKKSI